MPEGDSLHRAAERLRVLEGEVLSAESPHPGAAALRIAERIDGRRLERVQAVGKNLLLTFEGGLVVRSHLRMRGRWRIDPVGSSRVRRPWLVLRGRDREAVLWNGPVLEVGSRAVARLGPDVMADPPDIDAALERLRATDQAREIGEALLDQRLVAGIGNKWKAEGLFEASTSPWARLRDLSDATLRDIIGSTARLMRAGRRGRAVYRRAGLPCRRCGETVRSTAQGEHVRTAYWCPRCQAGTPHDEA